MGNAIVRDDCTLNIPPKIVANLTETIKNPFGNFEFKKQIDRFDICKINGTVLVYAYVSKHYKNHIFVKCKSNNFRIFVVELDNKKAKIADIKNY